MVECVSALAVNDVLQTHLYQSGVLFHLLIFLFNYDFTLEEGGVERAEESNKQVLNVFSIINFMSVLNFIFFLLGKFCKLEFEIKLYLLSCKVTIALSIFSD